MHEIIQNKSLFGVPYSQVSYDEAMENILSHAEQRNKCVIYTPNVQHFYLYRNNKQFENAYRKAHIFLIDGMPLVWLARCLHKKKVTRIAGSDIFVDLLCEAAKRKLKILIFGSLPGVAEVALKNVGLEREFKKTVYAYSPPFGFHQSEVLRNESVQIINKIRPDLLFVALGAPKAEIWISEEISRLNVGAVLSIGASVDFAAGLKKRAPLWIQKCGFEWAFRLFFEPRRLFIRYFVSNTYFLPFLFRAFCKRLKQKTASVFGKA